VLGISKGAARREIFALYSPTLKNFPGGKCVKMVSRPVGHLVDHKQS